MNDEHWMRQALSLAEHAAASGEVPGVSLGNYANVLFVLGLAERLGELADVKTDVVGLELVDARLPQRIRRSRK